MFKFSDISAFKLERDENIKEKVEAFIKDSVDSRFRERIRYVILEGYNELSVCSFYESTYRNSIRYSSGEVKYVNDVSGKMMYDLLRAHFSSDLYAEFKREFQDFGDGAEFIFSWE